MLEQVDLQKKVDKGSFRQQLPGLQQHLFTLQKACEEANIPTILVFEGWDAAGKTSTINTLVQRLDPRSLTLHDIKPPRTYETHMPWLWRFWLRIPNYGEMAVFDRSWYRRVLGDRVEEAVLKEDWRKAYRDIVNFERALADDGYVIIKFFLHISVKEQRRRLEKLQRDPLQSWRVQPEHWERHRRYAQYALAIEEMLKRTHTEWGPWVIVAATDRRWTRIAVFTTTLQRMEDALKARGIQPPQEMPSPGEADAAAPKAVEAVQEGE